MRRYMRRYPRRERWKDTTRYRRFYPRRYRNILEQIKWHKELNWDYTKCNVERRIVGWGRMRILGSYSDYIRTVNEKMRPKRKI